MLHGKGGPGARLGASSCSVETFSLTSQLTGFSWSCLCFKSWEAQLNFWLHSSHRYPACGAKTDFKHKMGTIAGSFERPFDSWVLSGALFGVDVACNGISGSSSSVNVSSSYETEIEQLSPDRYASCVAITWSCGIKETAAATCSTEDDDRLCVSENRPSGAELVSCILFAFSLQCPFFLRPRVLHKNTRSVKMMNEVICIAKSWQSH